MASQSLDEITSKIAFLVRRMWLNAEKEEKTGPLFRINEPALSMFKEEDNNNNNIFSA